VLLVVRATLRALLFGVTMWDPAVVAACVAAMVTVCILTAVVPALRANRISAAEILTA
jgi:ABC-type lipoprotein release transport system permease subunit